VGDAIAKRGLFNVVWGDINVTASWYEVVDSAHHLIATAPPLEDLVRMP
jgi:hypothetical protein